MSANMSATSGVPMEQVKDRVPLHEVIFFNEKALGPQLNAFGPAVSYFDGVEGPNTQQVAQNAEAGARSIHSFAAAFSGSANKHTFG